MNTENLFAGLKFDDLEPEEQQKVISQLSSNLLQEIGDIIANKANPTDLEEFNNSVDNDPLNAIARISEKVEGLEQDIRDRAAVLVEMYNELHS